MKYTFHIASRPKIRTDYRLGEMLTSKKMPKNWRVSLAGNLQLVDRKNDAVRKVREIHGGFGTKTGRRLLVRPRSRWKGNVKMDIE